MIITLRQATYIATMAVFGAQGALGSAAHTDASNAYASPDKIAKIQHKQPDFGFSTSQKTRDAFSSLIEENTRLWIRDAQSTALYRGLRQEINHLKETIKELKSSSGIEQMKATIERKEVETRELVKKNESLSAKLNEHAVLTGRFQQLQESYKELVTTIETKTNKTTRTNVDFAHLLAMRKQESAVAAKSSADSDISDDDNN